MERMNIAEKILPFLKKYRYAVLILALGLLLICLPEKKEKAKSQSNQHIIETMPSTEKQLEAILSKVEGAGDVRVLLTKAEGERTVYQTDRRTDGMGADTVIITDGERAQQGLVSQVDPPVYLGAVVVCKGGDNPKVRLAIVEAVSDATGLGADRITVLKMK